ncbi:hypothetical protein BDN70DRAFT_816990 [Pholiota conissans]|uniref:Uncharacterized protein n=1 Tax=Pholiota conissans TaxID=109636 RepID=A0A9P6CVH8_9AGAR|nr:hypothetical protein BDN70DRAFT_816990 [Pholiota conissans]
MRIRIKVYPPIGVSFYYPATATHKLTVSIPNFYLRQNHTNDLYVYRFLRDSFNEALRTHFLLFDMEVPISSTIGTIIGTVIGRMQDGPFAYSFREYSTESSILPHEALPLGLLRIVNTGRTRNKSNQVRLQAHPRMNDVALDMLVTEHAKNFVASSTTFEDKRFVIFLARIPVDADDDTDHPQYRIHSCIAQSIYARFPNDRQDNSEPDQIETSGGETDPEETGRQDHQDHRDSQDSDSDYRDYAPPPSYRSRYRSRSASLRTPLSSTSGGGPAAGSVNTAPPLSLHMEPQPILPAQLWSLPWIALPTEAQVLNLFSLDTSIFDMACGFRPPKLSISGENVSILADRLIEAIEMALSQQDFERILSVDREFLIVGRSHNGRQHIRSLGRGIEREVIYLAFGRYSSQEAQAQWFLPRAGGYSSIAVSHTAHSMTSISTFRVKSLSVLGALTGLMLVHGIAPIPLSPVLIHYFIHNCDLQSIHPAFLAEWIPDLHKTLDDWLSLDHQSDIAAFQPHFSTYHDMQVACLQSRDLASHKSIASEMLHRAIIGPEPFTHREIQAFIEGFKMPCRRTGFNMTKIKTLVEGGSESFLNMIWTSHIKSFEDIRPHIHLSEPSQNVSLQLQEALSLCSGISFEQLLHTFLKGSGIPCPKLFEDALNHFAPVVDCSKIDDDMGFRSRVFYWAATGSPSIEINSLGITMSLCESSDTEYAPGITQREREAMIDAGKICFKTCISQMKVPAKHIIVLARGTYTSNAEPHSFQAAFDHWLLCEILNSLGNHSIL